MAPQRQIASALMARWMRPTQTIPCTALPQLCGLPIRDSSSAEVSTRPPCTAGTSEADIASTTSRRPAQSLPWPHTAHHHVQLRGFAAQPAPESSNEHDTAHHASTSSHAAPTEAPLSHDVYYEGPLSKTHKYLKRVSIANTLIAFAAAPAIMYWADGVSYVSRVGLASALVFFGILTTGALHWITHPYVHTLHYRAKDQTIQVTTTTLFGRPKVAEFKLSEVQPLPWNRPVATFVANEHFYYIDVHRWGHIDVRSFPDEALLKLLTPPEESVPAGYKDDEDD